MRILDYKEFSNRENWIGGFYELSIEFPPVGDSNTLNQALITLQNLEFFNGLWQEIQDFQSDSISLPINIEDESVNQFYGTLLLPDENTLPCLISVIRIEDKLDWLDLSIPQASFDLFYPCKYPLSKELNPWLVKVEEIFIRIAETIYTHAPFELALIGEEISGYTTQEEITLEDLGEITCILPNSLQKRLGIQGKGEQLSKQLRLFS